LEYKFEQFRQRKILKDCAELGTTVATWYPKKKEAEITLIVTPPDFVGEVKYFKDKDLIQITDKENNSVLEINN
jgi:hypothetical protein